MPIEFGKRLNPAWDALRARTLTGGEIAEAAITITGGGVENKIYVWHADASTLDVLDADETGLTTALSIAATGDTVWLPSIPIALTAAITIPASVTLRGISDKASLSFSGFAGVAITLSASSGVMDVTVVFVATGSSATGISAASSDAFVQHVDVTVSGATVSNIAIGVGVQTDNAGEVWMSAFYQLTPGADNALIWTTELRDLGIASPTWHGVTPLPMISTDPLLDFEILRDGSRLFVIGADNANADRRTVWECSNLAAIRSAPATSATWSAILYVGQSITTQLGSTTIVAFIVYSRWQDGFICTLNCTGNHVVYGAYNGSWTFYDFGAILEFDNVLGPEVTSRQTFGGPQSRDITLMNTSGVDIGVTSVSASSYGISQSVWRSTLNTDYYAVRFWYVGYSGEQAGNYLFRFFGLSGAPAVGFITFPTGAGITEKFIMRGALDGLSVITVDPYSEDLFISEDRTTVASVAHWRDGVAEELKLSGGGDLVWMCFNENNGGEIVRLSDDRGATWHDRTGNFWSLHSGVFKGGNVRPVWLP